MDQTQEEDTALGMWLCVCVYVSILCVCFYDRGWLYEIASVWLFWANKKNNDFL